MPDCIVNGCNSSSGRRLPTDKRLREKWLEGINRIGFKPKPNSLVCLKHFHESDFIPDSYNKDNHGRKRKKRRLKPSAIPTLDLPIDVSMSHFESIEATTIMESSKHSPVSMIIKPDITSELRDSSNPWTVPDATVFLKYCCPECDYCHPNLPEFSEHALENHAKAIALFNNNSISDNYQLSNIKSEYEDDLKIEYPTSIEDIKEEPDTYDGEFLNF